MVGSGFTIFDMLKDASEAIGVVPVLKPIFASVAGLLRAVQVSLSLCLGFEHRLISHLQQTQVNFNEMKDLAFTAGDFALRLAETCSASPAVPSEVEHLIQRFNRYVPTTRRMLQPPNRYGKTIAADRGTLQSIEPKTVVDMFSPKLDS